MLNRVVKLIAFTAAALSLEACSGQPSKSEAGVALTELVTQSLSGLGMGPVRISVQDMKCQKQADSMYSCMVLGASNGQNFSDKYGFVKLGGKWTASANHTSE